MSKFNLEIQFNFVPSFPISVLTESRVELEAKEEAQSKVVEASKLMKLMSWYDIWRRRDAENLTKTLQPCIFLTPLWLILEMEHPIISKFNCQRCTLDFVPQPNFHSIVQYVLLYVVRYIPNICSNLEERECLPPSGHRWSIGMWGRFRREKMPGSQRVRWQTNVSHPQSYDHAHRNWRQGGDKSTLL